VIHLCDANVLITANNTYYAIDQVKEYWDWLQYQGEKGNIKIPAEIMDEILAGKNTKKGKKNEDLLLAWIRQTQDLWSRFVVRRKICGQKI
jgi:hypothetical protein